MSARAAATLAGRSGTAAAPGVPALVELADLRVGEMLAEGGEGRVFQLPRQPHLLYKSYRRPMARPYLEELVAWPEGIGSPQLATTIRGASAWPCSVVADGAGEAVGLLMPRAPRRFSLRHRDGRRRLASLSYLTADPAHRAVAYGLDLPAPVAPERVALVYALARLLAAFESPDPSVAHGDLSTKNVLWSLQRGPEVFVIDCDNCDSFGADGQPVHRDGRRRAMTPNWDDPAVPRGDNPTPASDRYSLALIFLRIVGAANFPVQARQRTAGEVEVAFPVPAAPGADVLLDPAAEVWDLCGRGLSLHIPDDRPAAADWLGPLEDLLAAMGRQDLARAVRVAQGQGSEAPAATSRVRTARPEPRSGDVTVVPVPAPRRPEKTWSRISPNPRYGATPSAPAAARPIGYQWAPLPAPAPRLPVASAQSASGAITAGGGAARGVTRLTGTGGSGGTAPVVGSNRANAAARPNALTPPRATARPGATAQPNALAQPGAVAQPRAVARPNAASGPGATGPVAASRITGAAPSPLGGGTPRPGTPRPGTPRPAGSPPIATATLPTTPTGAITAAPGGPPTDGAAVGDATAPAPGPGAEARAQLARFLRWWWGIHGAMIHALATPGRRGRGARSLLFCLVVDIAVLVLTAAAVALVVSPITQG